MSGPVQNVSFTTPSVVAWLQQQIAAIINKSAWLCKLQNKQSTKQRRNSRLFIHTDVWF